jgi:hypothetical protein
MYGFGNMSADYPQVRNLIRQFTTLLRNFLIHNSAEIPNMQFRPPDIVMIFNGLRMLDNQIVEVRELLHQLNMLLKIPIVRGSALSGYQITKCFHGFKNLSYIPDNDGRDAEIHDLLVYMLEALRTMRKSIISRYVDVVSDSQHRFNMSTIHQIQVDLEKGVGKGLTKISTSVQQLEHSKHRHDALTLINEINRELMLFK